MPSVHVPCQGHCIRCHHPIYHTRDTAYTVVISYTTPHTLHTQPSSYISHQGHCRELASSHIPHQEYSRHWHHIPHQGHCLHCHHLIYPHQSHYIHCRHLVLSHMVPGELHLLALYHVPLPSTLQILAPCHTLFLMHYRKWHIDYLWHSNTQALYGIPASFLTLYPARVMAYTTSYFIPCQGALPLLIWHNLLTLPGTLHTHRCLHHSFHTCLMVLLKLATPVILTATSFIFYSITLPVTFTVIIEGILCWYKQCQW